VAFPEDGAAATVTVTVLVPLPAALLAASVYVVVAEGVAVAVPEAGTDAPPGIILTNVAPVTFQLNVVFPPALMLVGLAANEFMTGKESGEAGAAATVTVTDLMTLPAALLAVRV
jgi:hypothetical protein